MAKKHIKLIKTLENDLIKHDLLDKELEASLELLKIAVHKINDEQVHISLESLPKPQEIQLLSQAVAIYTDGGCRGNPGPGASAYLIQNSEGEILEEGGDYFLQTTNNRMELLGPILALERMNERLKAGERFQHVLIFTDSNYVVQGMKSWVKGWKEKGWKKADGKEPENKDLWERLDDLSQLIAGVEWNWIKGHAGHPQNEYCDKKVNLILDDHLN